MAVDLASLARAAAGEPSARVTVNKAWLAEVHRLLTVGAAATKEAESLRTQLRTRTSIDEIGAKLWGAERGRRRF
jgi:DNA recombination-dependent growth factor C